jgi:hypothetical protein
MRPSACFYKVVIDELSHVLTPTDAELKRAADHVADVTCYHQPDTIWRGGAA